MISRRRTIISGYSLSRKAIFVCSLLLFSFSVYAQEEEPTTDELYKMARDAAFEEDDNDKAIRLIKRAIEKSPTYLELQLFLGRLYTWEDQNALARETFQNLLAQDEKQEQVYFAYANLEYWNDNEQEALEIVNRGLVHFPKSLDLQILKVKLLRNLREFSEATAALNKLLDEHPKNEDARGLMQSVRVASAINEIGVDYDYVYFDQRFDDPWHLVGLDYTRQTKLGSMALRFNYGNRFATDALQAEFIGFPSINNTFYLFVNAGISDDTGVFPRFRAGLSLYANIPGGWEADAGFRFLSFSEDTWIYTASVGKYVSNYWFNFRTYLVPDEEGISHSYSATVRLYDGGADDFWAVRIGYGIDTETLENQVVVDNADEFDLVTYTFALNYRTTIKGVNVVFASLNFQNQEYREDVRGNQITAGVGYIYRF